MTDRRIKLNSEPDRIYEPIDEKNGKVGSKVEISLTPEIVLFPRSDKRIDWLRVPIFI